MQREERGDEQVARKRASFGVFLTGMSCAVVMAVMLYGLAEGTSIIKQNIIDVEGELGWKEWQTRRMRRYGGEQGWFAVGILLFLYSAICGILSIAVWFKLKNNSVSCLGVWTRCHIVWLACLVLGGTYLSVLLFAAHAPTAAGLFIALLAVIFAGGVVCGVWVRRFFVLLFPGPWWRLCNFESMWPAPSSVVYVEHQPVSSPPPPPFAGHPPAAAAAANYPLAQHNPYASVYPSLPPEYAPPSAQTEPLSHKWPHRLESK